MRARVNVSLPVESPPMAERTQRRGHSDDTLHDEGERAPIPTHPEQGRRQTDPDGLDAFAVMGPGSEIGGRYVIDAMIGKGATGVVFDASHMRIGRRVALKCLYPQYREMAPVVERFFREAKIAGSVEHPNVIQVFDAGDEDGVVFIAMEKLEGESLGDRLDRGPMPVQEAVELFLGIIDGVAAVHERGIVHRDLKPDNIFIVEARPGRWSGPKVLDFGISKLKEPGLRELTTHGSVMGTPYYMAPEQIANTRDVDVRADVYSLGVMLYEALAGDVPFSGDSVIDIFHAAKSGDAEPLDRLRTDVPPSLAQLVARAMRVNREGRFSTVADMGEALRAISGLDTDPSTAKVSGPPERATVRETPAEQKLGPVEERATIREMPSPIRSLSEVDTPRGKNVAGLASGERQTLPPARPAAAALPIWAIAALLAMGLTTLFSIAVAILALALG
jgi:serine/threonine protein kinase